MSLKNSELLYSVDFAKLVSEFKDGVSIKDRKYHMKTYKSCFIGKEAVTWLINSGWANTREEAIELGNLLQSKYVLVNSFLFHNIHKKNQHQ